MISSGNPPVPRQQDFALGISTGWSPIRPVMDSRCLSAAGIRFLELPQPAAGLGLPCGRLTGGVVTLIPDNNGVTTFTYLEMRSGSDALYTPGSWCPPLRGRRYPQPALHLGRKMQPVTQVVGNSSSTDVHVDGASSRVRLRSPFRIFPCLLGPPDDWRRLGVTSSFAPRRYRRRTSKWGRVFRHSPGFYRTTQI